jgi:hypothetical protein
MKNVVKFAVAAVFAMAAPSLAQATTQEFQFDFTSASDSVTASGLFTVAANNEVTAITGTVSNTVLGPQTITGIVGNPNFPGPNNTGGFTYDNVFTAGDPVFDINGILFQTSGNPGGYWNLWGNGPGSYTLYASDSAGGYPVQESGTLSVTSVPEASTWAMMLVGFAGLGFVGYRRQKAVQA